MNEYIGLGFFNGLVKTIPQSVTLNLELSQLFSQLFNLTNFTSELRMRISTLSLTSFAIKLEFFSSDSFLIKKQITFFSMIS